MSIINTLKDNFSADLRSLAITRIAFAILMIIDLAIRSRHIEQFFTDHGVMPLSALKRIYPNNAPFSLHAFSGEYSFELILFILAFFFAFLLLIGLFTRMVTVICWLLLISLNLRNPMILHGGDTLFKCLMFWSIFMPWDERFSVDSFFKKNRIKEKFHFSIGSFAFIFQLMMVYFFTATLKSGSTWAENYTAVYYALSIGHFSYMLGPFIYKFPMLMKAITFLTYWSELIVPFLLLIPYKNSYFRYIFIVTFGLLQLGLALTLRIGLFPWFSMASLLILLPSSFWEFLPWIEKELARVYLKAASKAGTVIKSLGDLKYYSFKLPGYVNNIFTAFVVILLFYLLLWNLHHTYEKEFKFIEKASFIGRTLQIRQKWNMFAPNPYKTDGWFVIVGRLDNGELVDVFREGKQVSWDPPDNRHADYPTYRWRKFMRNMYRKKYRRYKRYFADYVCNDWNRSGQNPRLLDIDIYYVVERNLSDYRIAKPYLKKLYSKRCRQTP